MYLPGSLEKYKRSTSLIKKEVCKLVEKRLKEDQHIVRMCSKIERVGDESANLSK